MHTKDIQKNDPSPLLDEGISIIGVQQPPYDARPVMPSLVMYIPNAIVRGLVCINI